MRITIMQGRRWPCQATHLSNILIQQPEGVAHIEVLPVDYEATAVPVLQGSYQLINQLIIFFAPRPLLQSLQAAVPLQIAAQLHCLLVCKVTGLLHSCAFVMLAV